MSGADIVFVLRKAAGFAVSPYVWLLLLLLLCVVLIWRGRRGLAAALLGLAIASLTFIAFVPLGWGLIHQRETLYLPAPIEGPVDGIILLGGGERLAVSAHWGRAEINEAGDRVIAAAMLARQFPQARILVTGGHAEDRSGRPPLRSEAALSAEILTGLGVDADRLLIEDHARNTPENARQGLARATPAPGSRWVLVTSGFHMDRALRQFRQAGWEGLVPYPVDFRTTTWDEALGWSPYRNLSILESGLREQLGRLALWIGGL